MKFFKVRENEITWLFHWCCHSVCSCMFNFWRSWSDCSSFMISYTHTHKYTKQTYIPIYVCIYIYLYIYLYRTIVDISLSLCIYLSTYVSTYLILFYCLTYPVCHETKGICLSLQKLEQCLAYSRCSKNRVDPHYLRILCFWMRLLTETYLGPLNQYLSQVVTVICGYVESSEKIELPRAHVSSWDPPVTCFSSKKWPEDGDSRQQYSVVQEALTLGPVEWGLSLNYNAC